MPSPSPRDGTSWLPHRPCFTWEQREDHELAGHVDHSAGEQACSSSCPSLPWWSPHLQQFQPIFRRPRPSNIKIRSGQLTRELQSKVGVRMFGYFVETNRKLAPKVHTYALRHTLNDVHMFSGLPNARRCCAGSIFIVSTSIWAFLYIPDVGAM